ncbi:tRNA pseudouridine synthase A [Halobaculum sp. MBLA0147]|uniref:tRNA pseudouridine synthase A n=1 Tax=Halobaculum sp. MBLA0147 TaxID=3079934 RepID=UPI003525E88F
MRAYRVAYDGRPFHGFQRQPDVPTVSDAILDALVSLELLASPDDPHSTAASDESDAPPAAETADAPSASSASRPTPSGYAAAGRTDAGVSAVAQTVAFDAPDWLAPRPLNAHLPDAVHVWAAADVPDDFHATHDATRRRYRYHLVGPHGSLDPTAERPTGETTPESGLSLDRARAAAEAVSGTHDFADLTPDETGTERTLSCSVDPVGGISRADAVTSGDTATRGSDTTGGEAGAVDGLVLRVAADGFPRQLVRRLATVVRGVATGETTLDRVRRLLDPEPVATHEGVPPAPPEPLVLTGVDYPDVAFERDDYAVADARAAFETRRRRSRAVAHVAETVLDGL